MEESSMSYDVSLLRELHSFRKVPPKPTKHYVAVENSNDAEFAWELRWGRERQHGGHQSQRQRSVSAWRKWQQEAGDPLRWWSWEFRANLLRPGGCAGSCWTLGCMGFWAPEGNLYFDPSLMTQWKGNTWSLWCLDSSKNIKNKVKNHILVYILGIKSNFPPKK